MDTVGADTTDITFRQGGLSDYASVAGTANNDGAMRIGLPMGTWNGTNLRTAGNFNNSGPGAMLTSWKGQINLLGISDGTSNTALIGEKHVRRNSFQGKADDRSVYDGHVGNAYRRFLGRELNDPADPPNPILYDRNIQAAFTDPATGLSVPPNQCFGTWHPGACQFVFADGSVHGIPPHVSIAVLTYLGLPNDGQTFKPDW
jgi:prepilin-type processing-associated H-X9-DG protein